VLEGEAEVLAGDESMRLTEGGITLGAPDEVR
jgi:hypothetical protein